MKKSDWSRAFNQFTIACELDMINVISATDNTFIMSSSTSAWLLSPLECNSSSETGAYEQEHATSLYFCHGVFIDRFIFKSSLL